MENKTIRLFVAIDVPEKVKKEIVRSENHFKKIKLFSRSLVFEVEKKIFPK